MEAAFGTDQFEFIKESLRNCLEWADELLQAEYGRLRSALDYDPEQLLRTIHKLDSASGVTLKDSQIRVLRGDGIRESDQAALQIAHQIVVILDDLRSVFNVGSIIRTSECLGIAELAICGSSPGVEHPSLEKTAMGAEHIVRSVRFENSIDAIGYYRENGYRIVALETTSDAKSIFKYVPNVPVAIILGNESLGISEEVLNLTDERIAIPVQGIKNSLNVGVAFAVTAYQIVFGNNK